MTIYDVLIETESCRYGTMSFFSNDNTISRSLKEYGEWAQAEVDLLELLIGPGDTVLDVGAYIGTHSLPFSRAVGTQGTVYAFEPQPAFFKLLQENLQQNGLTNIKALNVAVLDKEGALEIEEVRTTESCNFGGAAISQPGCATDAGGRRLVEVMRIDQLRIEKCALIKIDAESMELNVLKGALETLRKSRPTVYAECNSLEFGWPVAEFAMAEGYTIFLFAAPSYNPNNFRHSSNNFFLNLRESGLILVPREKADVLNSQLQKSKYASEVTRIATLDDLALGLLKKPQYKHEVMAKTRAATVFGVDFWANEPELEGVRRDLATAERNLADSTKTLTSQLEELRLQHAEFVDEKEKEVNLLNAHIARLDNETRNLAESLGMLRIQHEQVNRELRAAMATLNQIQNSHGWKALSAYYRVRDKVIPRRIATILREGPAFLRHMRMVSASGLFDKAWYQQQNPDVAQARVSPLRHYLRRGGFEGRDPNPLFDSDWYLQQNPDVAQARINPLVHYLSHGAKEGRAAGPYFDTAWYLKQYPDVAKAGVNPLFHYLQFGVAEGRRGQKVESDSRPPSPDLNSALTIPSLKKPPILQPCPIGLSQPKRLGGTPDAGRVLCFTHVLPYPCRAGNEYRIHRMLRWLATTGYEIFLVVCPLPNYEISPTRLRNACSVYPNLVICERDGKILHQFAGGNFLKELTGVKPRDVAASIGEQDAKNAILHRLLPVVRTFCPDTLVETLVHLDSLLQPDIILAEYIFMTRALPLLRRDALHIVDTHDVFSSKHEKILQFGIEDGLALSAEEEGRLLASADLVIAIQSDEAAELQRLAPDKRVITVGVDFDPVNCLRDSSRDPIILIIGSENAMNVKGLRDFLRFAWPIVRRELPNAQLHVVGSVGSQIEILDPAVKIIGPVDDVFGAYAAARVVVNPAVAGTGLKIKTIEALCYCCPLVTWPSGVDGVEADMRALCFIATDWYMFAQHVIRLCQSSDAFRALMARREEINRRFSSNAVYNPLAAALDARRRIAV